MNLIPHWRWLRAMRRTTGPLPDAADLGTAFGLDASFDDMPPSRPAPGGSTLPTRSERTGLPRPA